MLQSPGSQSPGRRANRARRSGIGCACREGHARALRRSPCSRQARPTRLAEEACCRRGATAAAPCASGAPYRMCESLRGADPECPLTRPQQQEGGAMSPRSRSGGRAPSCGGGVRCGGADAGQFLARHLAATERAPLRARWPARAVMLVEDLAAVAAAGCSTPTRRVCDCLHEARRQPSLGQSSKHAGIHSRAHR